MTASIDPSTGCADSFQSHPATARHQEFINLTMFIACLRSEGLVQTDYFFKVFMFFALEIVETYLLVTARYLQWAVHDVFIESHKQAASSWPITEEAKGGSGHEPLGFLEKSNGGANSSSIPAAFMSSHPTRSTSKNKPPPSPKTSVPPFPPPSPSQHLNYRLHYHSSDYSSPLPQSLPQQWP